MHHVIISLLSNIDTHTYSVLSFYYIRSLYMFRTGSPIIRRFKSMLYMQLPVFYCNIRFVVLVKQS